MARAVRRADSGPKVGRPAGPSGEAARGWERPLRAFDVVAPLWRLLASAQFAMAILGFLALAGLLAVVLPQAPEQLRDNPAAVSAWTELRRDDFGPLTDPMRRFGLFNVVDSWWFTTGLALLGASVLAYLANRLPALWRGIARPQERVPDAFFDRAANRVAFATEGVAAGDGLEAVLRARRFRVERSPEGGTAYLFADRFAWAQIGGFVSHLAVILFLAGGFATWTGGFSSALFIAEGATQPVFPVSHPSQMQVEVLDAVGAFDETGTPLDYRSELVIYRDGQEVTRGVATVNDPVSYGGYRFHQAAYFGEGAALRVRDAGSGNTVFREVLELRDRLPAPVITVRDAQGGVLLSDTIVPTERLEGVWGTPITVLGTGRDFWVGVRQDESEGWRLVVFGLQNEGARVVVPEGESRRAGDLEFALREVDGLPSTTAPSDVAPPIPGDEAQSLVVLSETPEGTPYLTLRGPVEARALTLFPGEPVRVGDREYVFEGQREFAGIEVRKDPGATFIWVAVGLLLAGLAITFYVPRLRLWARVRGDEAVIAGQAERSGAFRAEAKRLARALGVRFTGGEDERDA